MESRQQQLTAEEDRQVKEFCRNLDEFFEYVALNKKDAVHVAKRARPNLFDLLWQLGEGIVRDTITQCLLKKHTDAVFDLFGVCWKGLVEPTKESLKKQGQLMALLLGLGNLTDFSDEMCHAMGEKGYLQILLDGLKSKRLSRDLTSYAMTLIYNCSWRVPENRVICRGWIDMLQEFAESKESEIQADAFLALSYIVDKSESEKITLNKTCVKFLLKALESALRSPDRRSKRFLYSVLEITQGINQLAINDGNKILIMDFGGLTLLERILVEGASSEEEKKWAARGVWQLAFKEENKMKIRRQSVLMGTLKAIKEKTSNRGLLDACSGALFVISDVADFGKREDGQEQGEKQTVSRQHSPHVQSKEGGEHHIMISYQHGSQQTMLKVKRFLEEHGYTVWMDVDKMKGDILEAMAQAVQDASVVLVCMTGKFKESQNCRTEATYAYTLKKDIVPLMLQDKFTPNDWLGAMMGMKKYFPMFSDDLMRQSLPDLIKELGDRGRRHEGLVRKTAATTQGASAPPPTRAHGQIQAQDSTDSPGKLGTGESPKLHQHKPRRGMNVVGMDTWDGDRVRVWLRSSGVDTTSNKSLDKLTGLRLQQLHSLLNLAPEFCVKAMKEELGLSFWDILSLIAALEKC